MTNSMAQEREQQLAVRNEGRQIPDNSYEKGDRGWWGALRDGLMETAGRARGTILGGGIFKNDAYLAAVWGSGRLGYTPTTTYYDAGNPATRLGIIRLMDSAFKVESFTRKPSFNPIEEFNYLAGAASSTHRGSPTYLSLENSAVLAAQHLVGVDLDYNWKSKRPPNEDESILTKGERDRFFQRLVLEHNAPANRLWSAVLYSGDLDMGRWMLDKGGASINGAEAPPKDPEAYRTYQNRFYKTYEYTSPILIALRRRLSVDFSTDVDFKRWHEERQNFSGSKNKTAEEFNKSVDGKVSEIYSDKVMRFVLDNGGKLLPKDNWHAIDIIHTSLTKLKYGALDKDNAKKDEACMDAGWRYTLDKGCQAMVQFDLFRPYLDFLRRESERGGGNLFGDPSLIFIAYDNLSVMKPGTEGHEQALKFKDYVLEASGIKGQKLSDDAVPMENLTLFRDSNRAILSLMVRDDILTNDQLMRLGVSSRDKEDLLKGGAEVMNNHRLAPYVPKNINPGGGP